MDGYFKVTPIITPVKSFTYIHVIIMGCERKKHQCVMNDRTRAVDRSIDRLLWKKKTEWEKERKTKTNQMKLKIDTKQRRWRRCFRPVFGWKFTSAGYGHIYTTYIYTAQQVRSPHLVIVRMLLDAKSGQSMNGVRLAVRVRPLVPAVTFDWMLCGWWLLMLMDHAVHLHAIACYFVNNDDRWSAKKKKNPTVDIRRRSIALYDQRMPYVLHISQTTTQRTIGPA